MEEVRARRHLGEVVLGRYLVDRLVGVGSFAWVYHARSRTGRDVAIKVLYSEDPAAAVRFAREVRVLEALPANPHVAGYVDAGRSRDGRPLLGLEYVDGITLRQGMEGRPTLETRKAAAFLAELCQAFVGLHGLGVVHRDVKPENILLARTGGIKLIDFGLIRDAQGILRLLESEEEALGERIFAAEIDAGVLAGTPEYMAPEQFSDSAAEGPGGARTDTASDVFSLGVILFQLLTGRKPFPMQDVTPERYPAELLRYFQERIGLTDHDVPPIPNLEPALESVVRKALRAEPRRRQPDAKALQRDLRRYLRTGRGVADADESRTVSVPRDQIFPPSVEVAVETPAAGEAHASPFDGEDSVWLGPTAPRPAFDDDETTAVRAPGERRRRRIATGLEHTAPFFEQDRVATIDETSTGAPADPEPDAPARGERARQRSEVRRRQSRETVSIFDQDTRKVNVSEVLPEEVEEGGDGDH